MTGPDFVDTNVFVYAYDPSDSRKNEIAREFLRRALNSELTISTQVVGELAATLLHRISPPVPEEKVAAIVDAMRPVKTISTDTGLIRRAVEAHSRYGLHFYDGMIVAAAERGGCSRIWSEDFNAPQSYFGITVANPFA